MARVHQVTVEGVTYAVTAEDGQVRVHLPFSVDPHQFSAQLQREGYGLAHPVDTPDTQGWGPEFSPNGYYPYYLFPDPTGMGQYVFAFYPNPEDVIQQGTGEPVGVVLGSRSLEVVHRWVPVLARLGAPSPDSPPDSR